MKNKELHLWMLIVGVVLILIALAMIAALIFGLPIEGIFSKLLENEGAGKTALIIASAVVIVAGLFILGLYYNKKKQANQEETPQKKNVWDIKQIVVGALCLGLAFVLSYIRIFEMPQGGSITAASMLPIVLYSYIYGVKKGLILGLAFGVLNLIQNAYIVHWVQLILDYLLAFTALGLGGIVKKHIAIGITISGLTRLAIATISGVIFFPEYAPVGQSVLWYSLTYNAAYMLPEMAICIVIVLIPAIHRMVESLKNQYRPIKSVTA